MIPKKQPSAEPWRYTETDEKGIKSDRIVINMGPQHPSTHGVFRAVVTVEGETILSLKPVVGYLHRNHEKIGERNTFLLNMPYTDRLDYFNSMSNNFGYALAVEKLMNIPGCRDALIISASLWPNSAAFKITLCWWECC
jgi:NADH-quinone oxidoreductase subunit D/NADH-quinone oxidoreductase subunit C/D